MLISIFLSLLPVPVFYLIYFRHFALYYRIEGRKPVYSKHIESFLSGIALALVIILLSPYIELFFKSGSPLYEGFIKAALIEKLGAFIIIYFIQRNYPGFNILEAVISGILVGTGFSTVENILYGVNFGSSVIIVRILFSVPLHITTCGLIGYFTGIANLSSTHYFRTVNLFKGLLLPYIIHGTFDAFILRGDRSSYIIGPMIIILAGIIELFITWSKIIPSRIMLNDQKLRLEDWMLKYRQPRYERWILNSMGTSDGIPVPFFTAHRGKLLWIMVIVFFLLGGLLYTLKENIAGLTGLNLTGEEEILLVLIYPLSIGVILMLAGSINPKFFTSSVTVIPVIFDAVLSLKGEEQNLVTFDITPVNCFLRTFESLQVDNETKIYFESRNSKSPEIQVEVVWENHTAGEAKGTIIKLLDPGYKFYIFLIRYYIFRLIKGVIFNLKLPGAHGIRGLFLHPSTVMQKEVIYQPGSIVFRQGAEVNSFYYIKKGMVDFFKETASGEKIYLDTAEAGQIFNEMALLGDKKRTVTAECRTLCVLAEARVDNLEALIRYNPDFAYALVRKLAGRADQTQNYLTQTIDYLRSIVQINSKRVKNLSLLLMQAAENPENNTVFQHELDIDSISRMFNVSHDDIIEFINSTKSIKKENGDNSSDENKLEKALSSINIDIVHKDNKLILNMSRKKRHT